MDNIILDLGFDVNVLPNKTWYFMGKSKLVWSHVQLRLVNKHKIVLSVRLTVVPMKIDGVCNVVEFQVIDIVDEK